jgi:hypothetical protein
VNHETADTIMLMLVLLWVVGTLAMLIGICSQLRRLADIMAMWRNHRE